MFVNTFFEDFHRNTLKFRLKIKDPKNENDTKNVFTENLMYVPTDMFIKEVI